MRELRTKAGLRQEDLAELIGEPQSFVSKYESGERRLDVLELRHICNAIRYPLPRFAKVFERELKKKK